MFLTHVFHSLISIRVTHYHSYNTLRICYVTDAALVAIHILIYYTLKYILIKVISMYECIDNVRTFLGQVGSYGRAWSHTQVWHCSLFLTHEKKGWSDLETPQLALRPTLFINRDLVEAGLFTGLPAAYVIPKNTLLIVHSFRENHFSIKCPLWCVNECDNVHTLPQGSM